MLTAHHLSKSFGVQTVLDSVSFSVNRGEPVGLVGPNGCGKTTLLRILTGQDEPDSGTVQLTPSDLRIGYLAQGVEFRPDETLVKFLARGRDDAELLTAQVERLAEVLAGAPDRPDLQREYDAALTRLASASSEAGHVRETLSALGLAHLPMTTPVPIHNSCCSTSQRTTSILICLNGSNAGSMRSGARRWSFRTTARSLIAR
jgi:ATPase subunit of ABC transporter with duplicated ATPase domains